MTTFYTPATGYPDLEARIAYGLARVGLECSDHVEIRPQPAFYEVQIAADPVTMHHAMRVLAARALASEHMYIGQPGIQPRYSDRYAPDPQDIPQLHTTYAAPTTTRRSQFRQNMCGHENVQPWGGSKGFILAASPYVGKPAKRNKAGKKGGDNLRLCATCGALVMLATHNFVFQTNIGERDAKRAVMTPIPTTTLTRHHLVQLQSAQKLTPTRIARADIPAITVPLAFLARFPHAAHLISETDALLHTVVFDPSARDRIIATQFESVRSAADFTKHSPFNQATVQWLVSPRQPIVDPLVQLTRALTDEGLRARRSLTTTFARSFVASVDPENPRLLHADTANYLATEVAMIPKDIMTNESITSVASTLRYFVRKRNYGFVDNIRNARYDSQDLERTLSQMLRQAQVHSADDTQAGPRPWLPDDTQISDVVCLAAEGPDQFENVKLALTLLALTRWHGREQEPQQDTENASLQEAR